LAGHRLVPDGKNQTKRATPCSHSLGITSSSHFLPSATRAALASSEAFLHVLNEVLDVVELALEANTVVPARHENIFPVERDQREAPSVELTLQQPMRRIVPKLVLGVEGGPNSRRFFNRLTSSRVPER
jgi:hypothetical protein